MENKNILARQTGIKVTLGEIVQGKYVQEDEQSLNYLLTTDQRKIYRVNVVGIIIHTEKQGNIFNLWLEDGTGKAIVRFFEDNKIISSLNPGEIINVIGRIRQYNQEKYLTSEIVKKVDSSWLKLRKMELKEKFSLLPELKKEIREIPEAPIFAQKIEIKPLTSVIVETPSPILNVEKVDPSSEINEEEIEEEIVEETPLLPTQKILILIKELDQGTGVLIEEILSKSPLNDTEKLLSKMLEKGDIFQNLPGKVKVL